MWLCHSIEISYRFVKMHWVGLSGWRWIGFQSKGPVILKLFGEKSQIFSDQNLLGTKHMKRYRKVQSSCATGGLLELLELLRLFSRRASKSKCSTRFIFNSPCTQVIDPVANWALKRPQNFLWNDVHLHPYQVIDHLWPSTSSWGVVQCFQWIDSFLPCQSEPDMTRFNEFKSYQNGLLDLS